MQLKHAGSTHAWDGIEPCWQILRQSVALSCHYIIAQESKCGGKNEGRMSTLAPSSLSLSLLIQQFGSERRRREEKVLATLISLAALSLLAHPHTPSQIKQMNGEEAAESSSQGQRHNCWKTGVEYWAQNQCLHNIRCGRRLSPLKRGGVLGLKQGYMSQFHEEKRRFR